MSKPVTVTVIGVDGKTLPAGASAALDEADLVVGLRRQLDAHAPERARTVELGSIESVLTDLTVAAHAVVLADGDPGFFGLVRTLRENNVRLTVLPAVSGVQRLLAGVGRPSDDVTVVNADDGNAGRAVNVCRARPAVAVLGMGPAELARELRGWRRTLVVAEDLGGPDEKVSTVDAGEAGTRTWRDPSVVLCLAEAERVPPRGWIAGAQPLTGGWALPEDEFAHRDGLVSSAELRAIALARLAPAPGTLVWDVGAGSGATAVECARLGSAALAVERDPMQCLRILANSSKYGVDVRVVEAELLAAISGLPKPDAVFIGGGGEAVVRACTTVEASRVVVALASIDRVAPTRQALQAADYRVDGCQLSAARLAEHSDGATRLAAVDPVTVVWGVR
ncbi:bifunctional cobalt-precorrin-7 (C(5))-methyltransferase/cobalt-precorrin-6B (C(15))-methyltransferase [Kibdelosporangium phytohabitans]|uniref:bifunctional cobalt-precorrin-7 (C(5))-methyltransferase/cobalt-precorrin-6B (C(15))-methyltransferase n=1 Tax=Kibdelosporangium phytohabitans TaxID=860235 RepID=UPI001A05970F|nr:bifunctional cobalt-precorrin-7 (C(5))-methyltransferase CbiE/decarboxylating cobalt-precorrin-6B (C(15))-methyltransferase CbiT [Kibdelosporangium phytohabitans]MBE1462341.1 precorrin-6Y C5,15-methyltransferase (decarboxylating) [Kibdelosporangium phytohabitans]